MASDTWVVNGPTRQIMEHAIANWHPHLAGIDHKILILFREKASKRGGRDVFGKAGKVNASARALAANLDNREFIFQLEIAGDVWQSLSENERLAGMDWLLCHLRVEEKTDKNGDFTGETNYRVVGPEINAFKANLRRFGAWMDVSDPDDDGDDVATALDTLKGSSGKVEGSPVRKKTFTGEVADALASMDLKVEGSDAPLSVQILDTDAA